MWARVVSVDSLTGVHPSMNQQNLHGRYLSFYKSMQALLGLTKDLIMVLRVSNLPLDDIIPYSDVNLCGWPKHRSDMEYNSGFISWCLKRIKLIFQHFAYGVVQVCFLLTMDEIIVCECKFSATNSLNCDLFNLLLTAFSNVCMMRFASRIFLFIPSSASPFSVNSLVSFILQSVA